MAAKEDKFTREQKDALKRARHKNEEYLRVLENSCLDYQKVIPDWVYEDAKRENALGNPYNKRRLDRMTEVSKYKDKIGPLAKQGLYRYDMSEQFDDGDQTPITVESPRSWNEMYLKGLWGTNMDWHPHIKYLSPLTKCLLLGDYDRMMDLICDKKGDGLRKMLESRETFLKVPALFHVVRGVIARNSGESEVEWGIPKEEKRYTHGACFMKLLELGANIHARDVVGNTLLFNCVRAKGCPETHVMAEILLQRGLDVNSVNRRGETALGTPIQFRDFKAIELLLSYGIDITIKDLNHVSARVMTMNDPKFWVLACKQAKLEAQRMKMIRAQTKEDFVGAVTRKDQEESSWGSWFLWVLDSLGLKRKYSMSDLVTDQGETGTCTEHALAKAVKLSLTEQGLNIDLTKCLASFLSHPNVDEEEGNFPDEFHGAKISSIGEESLRWPGSVELCIKRVSNLERYEDGIISTSKDTKLVLVYQYPKAGPHSVFISGVEMIANKPHFQIVNSWGPPQAGDPSHVRVSQEGNIVYEVKARWSPDGVESVCKVVSHHLFCCFVNFRPFQVCFAPESKVCTRCYTAHYCSKACQQKDREVHKQLCSEIWSEFQEVCLDWPHLSPDQIRANRNFVTGKWKYHWKVSESNGNKKHDILKIQKAFDEDCNKVKVEMGKELGFLDTALSVYSQHHEIHGYVSPKNPLYQRLKKSIEEKGSKKYKIYIKSCQRDGKLWINPCRILHPRTW